MQDNKRFGLSISLENDARGKYFPHFQRLRALMIALMLLIVFAPVAGKTKYLADLLSDDGNQNLEFILRTLDPFQGVLLAAMLGLHELLGKIASTYDIWKWKSINDSIETFSNQVFASHPDDPECDHRVTLFRAQNGCIRMLKPPGQTWLVPLARSGEITKRTKSIFNVSPNLDKRQIQGIAAKAWVAREGNWTWAEDIPLLTREMTEEQKQEYYDKTLITVDRALDMGYTQRAYAAIRMVVGGKNWGVLVLDSAHTMIPEHENVKLMFLIFAAGISPILEAI